MRLVVQRVARAKVSVSDKCVGLIGKGLVVLVAFHNNDEQTDAVKMAEKLLKLRVFNDGLGKMNKSALDVGGDILVVSQFTLYGNTKKGNRPSYIESAGAELAISLYKKFIFELKRFNIKVETGEFGANMQVEIVNDGPVTLIINS